MSTSTSAAVFESYVRTPNFEALAATLELSPELWDVFAHTEQRASAAGIAGLLGVTPEVALLGLRELAQHGLLRKHVQRWNEYRGAARPAAPAAVVAAPAVPPPPEAPVAVLVPPAPLPVARGENLPPAKPAAERTATPLAEPAPALPPPAPSPVAEARPAVRPLPIAVTRPREIRFTCGPKEGRRRPPAEPSTVIRFAVRRSGVVPSHRPAATEPVPAPVGEGWRLRPLLDAIVRRGGGGVPGQLLAYRVFLRVPAELLDRAGLHSLNLVDDDFVIRDPELHAAIRRSMVEVAGFADDTSAAPAPCSAS